MKTLITKEFVEKELAKQAAESISLLENSNSFKYKIKELIEDSFLSSDDLSDKIERMIEDEEAELSDELDIVLIQNMRTDALFEVLKEIDGKKTIKKIDANLEVSNPYIQVTTNDNREILVQCEEETSRLHADYGTRSICIDSSACEENKSLSYEEKQEILEELKNNFSKEVSEFEKFCDTDVREYLKRNL